jgi:uncharacterized protein YndB with AHSA1/START domain
MPTTTATPSSTDRIEKQVTIETSRSRVWRAITDVSQFNTWFGVSLGAPFVVGAEVSGRFTNAKYDHVTLTLWIEALEPERFFSFRWHPYPMEDGADIASEPTTLVTFTLDEVDGATRLTIVESGFDALPEARRATCFSMNSKGWEGQSQKLKKFLEG